MKISVAQTKAEKGAIERNIDRHLTAIELAIAENSDLILFPELSLTGYEPKLAEQLAIDFSDARLDVFQKISASSNITIAVGLPIKRDKGISIGMMLFDPYLERRIYYKQMLHTDELPYFIEGNEQVIWKLKNRRIAPAICYESLQPEHSVKAYSLGAEIYMASISKAQDGIEKAFRHYSAIAKHFSMPVLMCNSIGFCDNFQSAGQSAYWNQDGQLLKKLEHDREGLLLVETETQKISVRPMVPAKDSSA